MYNRYALERNGWKFRTRDKRKIAVQHIESDYLAPDTMEEIEQAMDLLSLWVGRAALTEGLLTPADVRTDKGLALQGRQMLENQMTQVAALNVTTRDFERSVHPTKILKVAEGYRAYQEMLLFACMRTLLQYLANNQGSTNISLLEHTLLQDLVDNSELQTAVHGPYMNMGGQIVSEAQIQTLMALVKAGTVSTWDQMHAVYDNWWKLYPQVKATYALHMLYRLLGCKKLDEALWGHALERFSSLCDQNALEVLRSRKKDHEEPFRKSTYRNQEEMVAVLGLAEDNQFVKESRRQMDELKALGQRFSVWS